MYKPLFNIRINLREDQKVPCLEEILALVGLVNYYLSKRETEEIIKQKTDKKYEPLKEARRLPPPFYRPRRR